MAKIPTDKKSTLKKILRGVKKAPNKPVVRRSVSNPSTDSPQNPKPSTDDILRYLQDHGVEAILMPRKQTKTEKTLERQEELRKEREAFEIIHGNYMSYAREIDNTIEKLDFYMQNHPEKYHFADRIGNIVIFYKKIEVKTVSINTKSIFQKQPFESDKKFITVCSVNVVPNGFLDAKEKLSDYLEQDELMRYPYFDNSIPEKYFSDLKVPSKTIREEHQIASVLEEIE